MRTRDLLFAALSAAIVTASLAAQQPPPAKPADTKPAAKPNEPVKPAPGSLDALVADAMKHNPEIQAAAAKVREAEIQLNKIRSEVMVQIAAQREVVHNAREMLRVLEQNHKAKEQLRQQAGISSMELNQSQIELFRARSEVAKLDAELIKLVGRVPTKDQPLTNVNTNLANPLFAEFVFSPDGRWLTGRDAIWLDYGNAGQPYYWPARNQLFSAANDGTVRLWDPNQGLYLNAFANRPAPSASIADKLRDAMAKPLKLDGIKNDTVANVLDLLKQRGLGDVPVRIMLTNAKSQIGQLHIELMAGELPLSAWLVAVQDSAPELRFVVRDYGLLVTTADRVPNDGLLLSEFLRRPSAKPAEAKKDEKPKQ